MPVKKFAAFFKAYGIALGVILAAMPLATKAGGLLPGYQTMKDTLTFSTSLISLLAIAVLFGYRRQIGQAVFPVVPGKSISREQLRRRTNYGTVTPIMLGSLAILGLIAYLTFLNLSIANVAEGQRQLIAGKQDMDMILFNTPLVAIPFLAPICLSYAMMFFGAATAFVWYGLIEYVQAEIRISDEDLIAKPYVLMNRHDFKLDDDSTMTDSIPFFYFEWDSQLEGPIAHVSGPLCETHNRKLQYKGKRGIGKHEWACIDPDKKKKNHIFILSYDTVIIRQMAKAKASTLLQAEIDGSLPSI